MYFLCICISFRIPIEFRSTKARIPDFAPGSWWGGGLRRLDICYIGTRRIGCQLQDLDICYIAPPHRRGAGNSHLPQKSGIPKNGALCAPDCLIPYNFMRSLPQNSPEIPRRASRAGLPHFSMFLLLFTSITLQILPGALRAPDCFSSL